MVKRRPSSSRWLREHHADPYVLQARKERYRSRAVYKLLEIQERFSVIQQGHHVVDLGAAPGGWTQVALSLVGKSGRVVAIDLLPMKPMPPAYVITGDFLDNDVYDNLKSILNSDGKDGSVDVILSDMAPNMSGFKAADQGRGELLAESAFEFVNTALVAGGSMVIKLFQGPGFHTLVREARTLFDQVKVVKPKASRSRSPENYLVGLDFRSK
ncbi:MAG: RlmE family RNA methyltransferase [Magnetococcales bacterium]|nr:RlmE family RNA methyltransferase [Magnetococcales bacterium]